MAKLLLKLGADPSISFKITERDSATDMAWDVRHKCPEMLEAIYERGNHWSFWDRRASLMAVRQRIMLDNKFI